jgi:hypothetical protein
MTSPHNADRRQRTKPGADRRPADADVHGQIPLGRQPIARAQRTPLDLRPHVSDDLIGTRFGHPFDALPPVPCRQHIGFANYMLRASSRQLPVPSCQFPVARTSE